MDQTTPLLAVELEADGRAPGRARKLIRDIVGTVRCDPVPPLLAVSEAVTNAVEHGYEGERGVVRLSAEYDGQLLTVTVEDDGQGIPRAAPRGLGLGLPSIAAMARDCALEPTTTGTRLVMRFRCGRRETASAERAYG